MPLDLGDHSVLIVDDEKFSRSVVAHLLEAMGRPKVMHASNGAEALDLLDNEGDGISFVIADFNMPVMHGLQLLKSIRIGHREINRAMPVAMVTGYSEKHMVDLALALDVNAFLIKPVSKKGLEKRLKTMLEQVGGDNWLKSDDIYSNFEVKSVLDEIVGTKKKPSDETPQSRRFFIKGKEEPLLRDMEPVSPGESEADAWAHTLEDEAEESERIIEKPATTKALKGYECALNDIPEGAILAKDVHTADGRLFMHAGAQLTPRIISILFDLLELGHPVDSIWIVK